MSEHEIVVRPLVESRSERLLHVATEPEELRVAEKIAGATAGAPHQARQFRSGHGLAERDVISQHSERVLAGDRAGLQFDIQKRAGFPEQEELQ